MDFNYQDRSIGRIVLELYKNILPKTCENFRLLCTGEKGRSDETATKLHYKNTIINRIVEQGWIQGGDIISGKGNGSESAFGGLFEGIILYHIELNKIEIRNYYYLLFNDNSR